MIDVDRCHSSQWSVEVCHRVCGPFVVARVISYSTNAHADAVSFKNSQETSISVTPSDGITRSLGSVEVYAHSV